MLGVEAACAKALRWEELGSLEELGGRVIWPRTVSKYLLQIRCERKTEKNFPRKTLDQWACPPSSWGRFCAFVPSATSRDIRRTL